VRDRRDRAARFGLRRTAPIVAIGGGVCTDIVGLAAALHRRGVPHIKVPTTLIGLIDAGIGTKNSVNEAGRKSSLGTFHPPEHSILDSDFLATVPRRHVVNGMAEMVKLATVLDADLFGKLEKFGPDLVESRFAQPRQVGLEVLRLSVAGMLSELSGNLYETGDYRRTMDFGHTFSPYFEVASGHTVLHGEAVAMDIALSAQVACELGVLESPDLEAILALLDSLGLLLVWPDTSVDALFASLSGISRHRDGDLHLVVPTGVGACTYLELPTVVPGVLRVAHERLRTRDQLPDPLRQSTGCRTASS
jgi:3-dehydroquinate synthetase